MKLPEAAGLLLAFVARLITGGRLTDQAFVAALGMSVI